LRVPTASGGSSPAHFTEAKTRCAISAVSAAAAADDADAADDAGTRTVHAACRQCYHRNTTLPRVICTLSYRIFPRRHFFFRFFYPLSVFVTLAR
jgi:hypothetical protein